MALRDSSTCEKLDREQSDQLPPERTIPFLKWPGGKRWLVASEPQVFPTKYKRYIEPFLGGGSVFFFLHPTEAFLSDSNPDLISAYEGIKSDWRAIVRLLTKHQANHSSNYYYSIRSSNPTGLAGKAARFIYLNRTCFNGIYRVNLKGVFNVPKGSKNSVVLPSDNFEAVAQSLTSAHLSCCDFEEAIDRARKGDLVFVDPPYTVRHNMNAFIKYNECLFSWNDQKRLAEALKRAIRRGAQVVSTNAYHQSIKALYNDPCFRLRTVSRYSSISADPESRKHFEELLILGAENG